MSLDCYKIYEEIIKRYLYLNFVVLKRTRKINSLLIGLQNSVSCKPVQTVLITVKKLSRYPCVMVLHAFIIAKQIGVDAYSYSDSLM